MRHLKPRFHETTRRVVEMRWRIVRHDGVLLGGSRDAEVAARMCSIICTGQPSGFARVTR